MAAINKAASIKLDWSDASGQLLGPGNVVTWTDPFVGQVTVERAQGLGLDWIPARVRMSWAPTGGTRRTVLADLGQGVQVAGGNIEVTIETNPIEDGAGFALWPTLLGATGSLVATPFLDASIAPGFRDWICTSFHAAPFAGLTTQIIPPPKSREFRVLFPDETSTWRDSGPIYFEGRDAVRHHAWSMTDLLNSSAGEWLELGPATQLVATLTAGRAAAGITLADILGIEWRCSL